MCHFGFQPYFYLDEPLYAALVTWHRIITNIHTWNLLFWFSKYLTSQNHQNRHLCVPLCGHISWASVWQAFFPLLIWKCLIKVSIILKLLFWNDFQIFTLFWNLFLFSGKDKEVLTINDNFCYINKLLRKLLFEMIWEIKS